MIAVVVKVLKESSSGKKVCFIKAALKMSLTFGHDTVSSFFKRCVKHDNVKALHVKSDQIPVGSALQNCLCCERWW